MQKLNRLRDKVQWHTIAKTRNFWKMEQLTSFMVSHLYELYDELERLAEFSDDWDYIQGSIDTTQVYLLKSGVEFLDHSAYIEKVESAKWTTI